MENKKFRALVVEELEDGSIIRGIKAREVRELPEGEVIIRVKYSSLNYKDALSSTGHKGVTRKYPHTPGIDAAGVVEWSAVEQFSPGDEALVTGYDLGMDTDGGFGQYIRVPASWVVPLPEPLKLRESMIYGTAGFTAALSIHRLLEGGVQPEAGEILVTGATGGVGCMSVAMLHKIGFNVAAVSGKPDAAEFLNCGASCRIISREDAVDTSGRPLLKGQWAGVVDTVGGEILETALKSTKQKAVVTNCGLVSSPKFSSTVYPFILRGIRLQGIDSAETPRDHRLYIWKKIAREWRIPDPDRFAGDIGLDQLESYIQAILKGKIKGRTVVDLEK